MLGTRSSRESTSLVPGLSVSGLLGYIGRSGTNASQCASKGGAASEEDADAGHKGLSNSTSEGQCAMAQRRGQSARNVRTARTLGNSSARKPSVVGTSACRVRQKTGVSPQETLVDRDIIRNEIDSGGVPWATWDEPHGRLHHLWIITRADHGNP